MFMEMLDILRKFIRAERSGNWILHIQKASEMLPFLAAAGHNNYTKSIQQYVQEMELLNDTNEIKAARNLHLKLQNKLH